LDLAVSVPRQAQTSPSALARVVTVLVGECGVRQFRDIGTGLTRASNTHQVAQAAAPGFPQAGPPGAGAAGAYGPGLPPGAPGSAGGCQGAADGTGLPDVGVS